MWAATGVKDRVRAALDISGIPEKGRLYFLSAMYYLVITCFVMMSALIAHNPEHIQPVPQLEVMATMKLTIATGLL